MRKIFLLVLLSGTLSAHAQSLSDAKWVTPSWKDTNAARIPVFDKSFSVEKKIRGATLAITAHGIYEATLNGRRIGNAYFAPGWTNYDKRLQYQQYDITKLLSAKNDLRITIAGGWYWGAFGHDLMVNRYGDGAALLLNLTIFFEDGTTQQFVSDESWRCGTGPVRYADFYTGEVFDARVQPGSWQKVQVKNFPPVDLVETINEPVTQHEKFVPRNIFQDSTHRYVIDFGQNLAGFVRIKVHGNKGDTIRVEHAEMLDKHGHFFTANLRDARATDIYILNSDGTETLEPHFTYHGFRYARVTGFVPAKNNCLAVALHNDIATAGTFACSNPLLNQLQRNITWSLNSNFMDVPTDCPQRSERLGWTGDAQVFGQTAAYNRNVQKFFAKWLADVRTEQGVDGSVPVMVPDLYHRSDSLKRSCAGWGDAATIIPWTMFRMYGDTPALAKQYESMKAWVGYIENNSPGLLWTARGYGDWYAPGDTTALAYIDQCFFAYSTQLVINAASVLSKKEDSIRYAKLLTEIKKAFLKNDIDADGNALSNTQTAYVLALQFDMLPDSLAQKAIVHLENLVHQNGDRLSTGFLGTPYLLHVLSKYGRTKLAYTLLNQQTCPSWLYPITRSATTIWERWDAIRPADSSLQQTSFNHYAYGAVGDWLFGNIAGITPLEPGFKKIKIAPQPGGGLTWAKASYISSFGKITSWWNLKKNRCTLAVDIPANTKALVVMPDKKEFHVGPGHHVFRAHVE